MSDAIICDHRGIDGRTLHEPWFPTDTGRAKFHAVELPGAAANGNGELRLMTVRSEGQFNTVVYEEQDIYRGQERRDIIMLHSDDIERLGLTLDQRVTVRSEAGALSNVVLRSIDIRPGNAVMYYPEANALVPPRVDPKSRTPTFKNTPVTIEPTAVDDGAERQPMLTIEGAVPRGEMRAC